MFQHFGELFSKNLQKLAHFLEKHEKSFICPKLATFRGNYHVSAFWSTFQEKVAETAKKHQKSSIWPKLATFRANYHVSAFWSTFPQKDGKSGSFREKARKIVDLAKTCNPSRKLPSFGLLVKFSAKSCKRWLIWWKSRKNHRFAQNLQFLEEITIFPRFGQLFSKKIKKWLLSSKNTKNHQCGQKF